MTFKTSLLKFDRANRGTYSKDLEYAITSRIIFRTKDIEVLYVEYVEEFFEIPSYAQTLSPDEVVTLARSNGITRGLAVDNGVLIIEMNKKNSIRYGQHDHRIKHHRPPIVAGE